VESLIRLLPDVLANQIAAGEVVQRPASVVKELLENAVDAGASEIILRVKEGGKTFIQVVDNGRGMGEMDARLCFERHATSKIREFGDMQKLLTYGFRGEALASIAAVSQLELRTRKTDSETGILVRIDGSECKAQEVIAAEKGSSFTVRNLFYNVPARRNFLKSNQVEYAHVAEEFNRVALAYPAISFSFYHGDALIQNRHCTRQRRHRQTRIVGRLHSGFTSVLPFANLCLIFPQRRVAVDGEMLSQGGSGAAFTQSSQGIARAGLFVDVSRLWPVFV